MDIRQLQYFVVSADCGSFKKAAELLYTTQPHISKCIRMLEEELQLPLMVRKARGVELTDAGKQVYATARQVLDGAEKITHVREQRKPQLRVGAQASDILTHAFIDLLEAWDGSSLPFYYIEGRRAGLLDQLVHGKLDIVFVYVRENMLPAFQKQLAEQHLQYLAIGKMQAQLLVGGDNPAYHAASVKERDLQKLKYVQLVDDADFFQMDAAEQLTEHSLFGDVDQLVTTNSRELLFQLLLNGEYASINCNFNANLLGELKIHAIPIQAANMSFTFGCVQSSWYQPSEEALKLIECVKKHIGCDRPHETRHTGRG